MKINRLHNRKEKFQLLKKILPKLKFEATKIVKKINK